MDRNLQREIGSLFLLGFKGPSPADDYLRLLDRYRPGAVIIFRDNLPEGTSSLPVLINRLSEAAGQELAIFMDEEGGWIQQLPEQPWPAPMAQAASGPTVVEECHRAMAAHLASQGVDVICGPLADLDDGALNPVIGSRAFGADPTVVSTCVAAAVRGLLAGGVQPILKHFPGHGDSREDSHLTLPTVPADRRKALIPFGAGLEAGATAVMTAHLRLGEDGNPMPATFRRDIIHGMLTVELGFTGLVVTDALEMGGTAPVSLEDRGALALAAGCHLLTLARWEPGLERMLTGMESPLERGILKGNLVDGAQERLATFLAPLESRVDAPAETPDIDAIDASAVFSPGGGSLPIWDGTTVEIQFGDIGSWRQDEFLALLKELPFRVIAADEEITEDTFLYIGRTDPGEEQLSRLQLRLRNGDPPLVLTCGPWGWTLPFPERCGTMATSPEGVRGLLQCLRRR